MLHLQTDAESKLTATLNAQTNNIINVGNMTGLVHGIDIRDFNGVQEYLTVDMDPAVPTAFTSTLEYIAYNLVIDFDDGNSNSTESHYPPDMGSPSSSINMYIGVFKWHYGSLSVGTIQVHNQESITQTIAFCLSYRLYTICY